MVFPFKPPFFLGKSHRSHGFPIRFSSQERRGRVQTAQAQWPALAWTREWLGEKTGGIGFFAKKNGEIMGKSWGNCWEIAGKWLFNYEYIYIYTHRIQSYLLRKWDWGIIYTIIWRVFCTFSDSVWIHRDGKLLGNGWDIDGTLGHLGLGHWLEIMDIYRIFKGMSALKP